MTKSFKNKNKANKIMNNCDEFVDKLQDNELAASGKLNNKETRPSRFDQ